MKTLEIIAFLFFFSASLYYIGYIIRDKNFIPNILAFGIWLIADIMNLVTYVRFSDLWVAPVLMIFCALSILIIAIIKYQKSQNKQGINNLDIIDIITIVILFISVFVWKISGDPVTTNLSIQLALGLGFIPVIKALVQEQREEPLWFWGLFLIGFIITLFDTAVRYQRWEELVFPLVGFIGEVIVVSLIAHNYIKKDLNETLP